MPAAQRLQQIQDDIVPYSFFLYLLTFSIPMGLIKKSTPRKTETKVIPDERDGTTPFIKEARPVSPELFSHHPEEQQEQEGQLSLDVFQTADQIVVVAPVAGVKANDLVINITDDVLTIKGIRSFQFNVDNADYFTKECFWGNFSRSIILPEAIDKSKVTASFKNGILTVRIPKVEKIHTRMIKIKEE